MSRVDELIAELAPEGVEFRHLGSLGKRNKGTSITASRMKTLALVPGPVRVFAGGQTIADVSEDAVPEQDIVRVPSIIVKSRGNIGFTYYEKPFSHKSELWSYSIDEPLVDQKYVYYYLLTQVHELQILARATSVKLPQLGVKDTDTLRIPVPPLEVQREIVRILDQFTQLEAELEAELEARRRQYEHYQRQIIEQSQRGSKLSLGEIESQGIVKLGRGKVISKIDLAGYPGDHPVYSSSGSGTGEFGRYGRYMFDDERITWSVDGGGRFFYRPPHKYSVTNVCGWMTIDSSVLNAKYFYYVLSVLWAQQTFDYTRKAHPSVIRDVYDVAIPGLEEQNRVVAALDSFDVLVNDLSVGLPAELKARRKQYEYYRDKLLTFEEAGA